jgi:hypothetical protein
MKAERKIIFYESYFQDFFLEQSPKVREKIAYVFKLLNSIHKIPTKFLNILRALMDFMRLELNMKVTYIGYFVVSIRVIW